MKRTLATTTLLLALAAPALAQTPAPMPTARTAVASQSIPSAPAFANKPSVAHRPERTAAGVRADRVWPGFLTIGQQQEASQRALEATFNIDHSP